MEGEDRPQQAREFLDVLLQQTTMLAESNMALAQAMQANAMALQQVAASNAQLSRQLVAMPDVVVAVNVAVARFERAAARIEAAARPSPQLVATGVIEALKDRLAPPIASPVTVVPLAARPLPPASRPPRGNGRLASYTGGA